MVAGRAARARAQERQGSGRLSVEAWYPELEAFRERGWNIPWIAEAVGLSDRQVRRLLKEGRRRAADLRELPVERDVAREDRDLLELTADAFEGFFNRFSGKKLPDHMRRWTQEFLAHRNLVLNVPPRHAKTTWVIWLVVWLLVRNRNEQILIVSKTQTHAENIARSIEMILSFNEGIIRTYGRFAPDKVGDVPWRPSRGELMILGRTKEVKAGDLSVQSRGMEQQILGMEATVVICDDITDAKIARSELNKEEELRKFRDEILSRIEPKSVGGAAGRALVVGQRVDSEDIYEELKSQEWLRGPRKGEPLWEFITMPAVLDWGEYDDEGHEVSPIVTLWPERFDREEIEIQYARFGEDTFETMYQQNPKARGERTIRAEWVQACFDLTRSAGEGFKERDSSIPIARVISIDPSPTEWNVGIVADVSTIRGNWACAFVDVDRWKGATTAFKDYVERALDEYSPDYLIVEESSFWAWFKEDVWFENLSRAVKVLKQHTGINKGDQELGADSLAADWEMRRFSIPYKDQRTRDKMQVVIDEALAWPRGKTFDSYMATWFIKWNRKKIKPVNAVELDHFFGTRPTVNATGRMMLAERDQMARRSLRDRLPA